MASETYNATFRVQNSQTSFDLSGVKLEIWRKGEMYDEFLFDGTTGKDGSFNHHFVDRHSDPAFVFYIYLKVTYNAKEYLYSLDGKTFGLFELMLNTGDTNFTIYIDAGGVIIQPSTDNVVTSTESRFFQLLDQDNNPLSFTSAGGQILSKTGVMADFGIQSTNLNGYFGVVINHTAAFDAAVNDPGNNTEFRFYVWNSLNNEIGSVIEPYRNILRSNSLHAYIVHITVAQSGQIFSESINDLAQLVAISISSRLNAFLVSEGITTLKGIRAFGGLKNIAALRSPAYAPDQPAINRLDGHARLEILSVNYVYNNILIGQGIDSFHKVLKRNYYDFIKLSVNLGMVKEYEAARLYDTARYHDSVFNNYVMAARNLRRGDTTDSNRSGNDIFQALIDAQNLYNEVMDKCHCDDCEAAVSPFAYLTDLIDYAEKNLYKQTRFSLVPGGGGVYHYEDHTADIPIPNASIAKGGVTGAASFLETSLHQPFYELRDDCEELNNMVCKYRLQVEVLYTYLQSHALPATQCQTDQLSNEVSRYLQTAYFTLLEMLGTSYEEVRNTRKGTPSERAQSKQELAGQIGIVADYQGSDTIDAIFLDPNTTDPTDPRLITSETLETIFGLRDFTRDALSQPAEPLFLTWMIAFLKQSWIEEDFQENDFIDGIVPIIDPDLIGPQDLVFPYTNPDTGFGGTNPAYTIWERRRAWLDRNIYRDIFRKMHEGADQALSLPGITTNHSLITSSPEPKHNSITFPNAINIPDGDILLNSKVKIVNVDPLATIGNELSLTVKETILVSGKIRSIVFYESIPAQLGKDSNGFAVPLQIISLYYNMQVAITSIVTSTTDQTLHVQRGPAVNVAGNKVSILGSQNSDGVWDIIGNSGTVLAVPGLVADTVSNGIANVECKVDFFEKIKVNKVTSAAGDTFLNLNVANTITTTDSDGIIILRGSPDNDGIYFGINIEAAQHTGHLVTLEGLATADYTSPAIDVYAYFAINSIDRKEGAFVCYGRNITLPTMPSFVYLQSNNLNQGLYCIDSISQSGVANETSLVVLKINGDTDYGDTNNVNDNQAESGLVNFTKKLSGSPTIDLTAKTITIPINSINVTPNDHELVLGDQLWLCTQLISFECKVVSVVDDVPNSHQIITYTGSIPDYVESADVTAVVYIDKALSAAPIHPQTACVRHLFARMTQAFTYPPTGTPVNKTPWSYDWSVHNTVPGYPNGSTYGNFTTSAPDRLLDIRNDLQAGVRVDEITAFLNQLLNVGPDAFVALMAIYEKYKKQEENFLNERVTDKEWSDLYNILLQCVKKAFYGTWVTEEQSSNIALSYRFFWQSLYEPVAGDLPPVFSPFTPAIDPDNIPYEFTASAYLVQGGSGDGVWVTREARLSEVRKSISNIYKNQGATQAIVFALSEATPGDTTIDDFAGILDDLGSFDTANVVTPTENMLRNIFFLEPEDLKFLWQVKETLRLQVSVPSPAEEARFCEILTQAFKKKYIYPDWINDEFSNEAYRADGNTWWLVYYNAFRMQIPAWRASLSARSLWQQALVYANHLPNIDSDLLTINDFFNEQSFQIFNATNTNPAADIWNGRRLAVQAVYNDFIAHVNQIGVSEADKMDYMIAKGTGLDTNRFNLITDQLNAGIDIRTRLLQVHLTMAGFRRLSDLYGIASDTGISIISSEWHEVVDICIQAWKERILYSLWNAQEKVYAYNGGNISVTVNPDYFVVPVMKYETLPALYYDELVKWRATRTKRKAYEKKLESRIKQLQNEKDSLAEVLKEVDEMTLPILRNALVQADGFDHQSLDYNARFLSDQLLMDFQINCCQYTTRVSQALDTLQELIWQTSQGLGKPLRSGPASSDYYGMVLLDPQFDSNWQWLGSYSTWRSAMFVFLYPENLLLPQLKREQSGAFRQIVQNIQSSSQFTPAMACQAARDYGNYFEDTAKIEVMATCTASLKVSFDECSSKSTTDSVCHFMTFGRGPKTGKIYWNRFPLTEINKTTGFALSDSAFWEPIDALGTGVIKIIGAVPYTLENNERWLFLYCTQHDGDKKKLVYLRFSMDNSYWETSAEDLSMPDWTDYDNILIRQTQDESNESQPLFIVRSSDVDDMAIYRNYIDKTGKDWEPGDWERIIGGAKGSHITKLLAAVTIQGIKKKDGVVLLFEHIEKWEINNVLSDHKSIRYQPFSAELDFGQYNEVAGVDPAYDDLTFLAAMNYDDAGQINVFYKYASGPAHQKIIKFSEQGLSENVDYYIDVDTFGQLLGDVIGFGFWGIKLLQKDRDDIQGQLDKGQQVCNKVDEDCGSAYSGRLQLGMGRNTTGNWVDYYNDRGSWEPLLTKETNLGALIADFEEIAPDAYKPNVNNYNVVIKPYNLNHWPTNSVDGTANLIAMWILKLRTCDAISSIIDRLASSDSTTEREKFIPEDLKLMCKYFDALSINRVIPDLIKSSGDGGAITLFDMIKAYCWTQIQYSAEHCVAAFFWLDRYPLVFQGIFAGFTYKKRHNFAYEVSAEQSVSIAPESLIPNWGSAGLIASQIRYCIYDGESWQAACFSSTNAILDFGGLNQNCNILALSNSSTWNTVQTVAGYYSISENVNATQLQLQASQIQTDWNKNADALPKLKETLRELYYFVPMLLGMQLDKRSYYEDALRWFKIVYDYTAAGERRIYLGLGLDSATPNFSWNRPSNWLQDPLNPHALAITRPNSYYKYTVATIANCFIDWGNSEFAMDTVESVSRARELYEEADDLLHLDIFQNQLPAICNLDPYNATQEITCQLNQDDITVFGDFIYTLFSQAGNSIDPGLITGALPTITSTILQTGGGGGVDVYTNMYGVFGQLHTAYNAQPPSLSITGAIDGRVAIQERFSDVLLKHDVVEKHLALAKAYSTSRYDNALSKITGKSKQYWLTNRQGWMSSFNSTRNAAGGSHLDGDENFPQQRAYYAPDPSASSELFEFIYNNPEEARRELASIPYVPISDVRFCIPPNPVFGWMSLTAEMNLFKIRNCMNIAGMRREIDPYSAPTDTTSGIPTIGGNGQIVIAGNTFVQPSDYRYDVIIERAKQQVAIAQQIETAFLSALEKLDAERYTILKAKQDLQMAKANVTLKDLATKVSQDQVDLAQLQKERAELNVEGLDDMINSGLNAYEERMLGLYNVIASLQTVMAIGDSLSGTGNAMIQLAGVDPFSLPEGAAGLALVAAGGGMRLTGSIAEAVAQAAVNINSLMASQARRVQEWNFQKTLAQQDVKIGSEQIKISQDQLRVSDQEKKIADLQQQNSEDTVQFLANKFTNAELYEWMSGVLQQVYAYFLQLSTSTAKMALNQVAFERQLPPPPFIQNSYWVSPTDDYTQSTVGNNAVDRRGLTGSARLLEDIYKVDDYAFSTDRRKLQLTKFISLQAIAPMDFQLFKQTGVITFETLMDYFDRDFPGHYMRVIKQVKASVIALVPPSVGIKATLRSSGISRVVLKGDTFIEKTIRRYPEEVALTGSRSSNGLFEMNPDNNKFLNPFEGSGVATRWQLEMPLDNNSFDYDSIADVVLEIQYTALSDATYAQQVRTNMGTEISLERGFSFNQEFADQFYELCHPEESATPMQVQLDISQFSFPANLKYLTIDQLKFYFVRNITEDIDPAKPFDGAQFNVACMLTNTGPNQQGSNPTSKGYAGINPKGIVSTALGGGSLNQLLGKSPFGTWSLNFGEGIQDALQPVTNVQTDNAYQMFLNKEIKDVIMVVSFTADLPSAR